MKLESGNVAIDLVALRKQFNLRPDEKSEEHHVQRFFEGCRWHVLADAGGSRSNWEKKRFIAAYKDYAGAVKCFQGWNRERPLLIYFQDDGTAVLVESSDYNKKNECLKVKLELAEKGVISLAEKERNKIICELDPSRILELGDDYGPDHIWYGAPRGKVYYNRVFGVRRYVRICPEADTQRMASLGDRLMLRHGAADCQPEFFIAPKDEVVCDAWVIGLMEPQ